MKFNKKKIVRLSLNLTLLGTLFPCMLLSVDLRQRNGNIIVSKTADLTQSSNKTDVINIKNPNNNGVSHNQFENFNVQDGVIFNNSLEGGKSQIGGWVNKNPNLKQNADTIINEISSKQASSINGAVEVFGKSANLIFANENGFSVNGTAFLNTKGVTLSTGKFNGNFTEVKSDGRVAIGEKGVMVDGDYFNVISRGIDLAGSIAHYQTGKNLSNINFIAGLNKVDLSKANIPKVVASKQNNKKIDYGIDGKYLGSMYANTVTFVSTEEGVGVRHIGVIRGLEDIIVKVKDSAEFQAIGVNAKGNIKIDAKNIKTSFIDANKIDLKANGKVVNEGLYKGKQIQINAYSFENTEQANLSKETKDTFGINQQNSKISTDNLILNIQNKTSNFGFINAIGDIKVNTNSFNNQGHISANKDIFLTLNNNDFINNGAILSQNNIKIQANKGLALNNDGGLYAQNLLYIKSLNNLNINSKLENSSSIKLDAKNIYIKDLVASGKDLYIYAYKDIINDGYLFSNNNLRAYATTLTNNSTFNSLNQLYLYAHTINNNALIFANKDIDIEANTLNNNANLTGVLKTSIDFSEGFGRVNYGDTAFKEWHMKVGLFDIVKYNNLLDSKQASIQAGKNININTQSKDNSRQVNNNGKILAKGNIVSFGSVNNKSLGKEISVKEILEKIKVDGFFAREYLGDWNTNSTYYFTNGESLLTALKYFSSNKAKDHQRESAWNALKDAAAKDSALNQYFSLLFGSDYASKRFVPDQKDWNLDAKVVFKAKSEATIVSNGKLKLNAKEYNQGLVNNLGKNFALVDSNLKKAINSRDLILKSIPDIINSGLFTLENKKNDGIFYKNTTNTPIVNKKDNVPYEYITTGASIVNGKGDIPYKNTTNTPIVNKNNNISYEYVTNTSIINKNEYFGFSNVVDRFKNKNLLRFNVIGDSFFENQLINTMYSNSLQASARLSKEEIKKLFENGVKYANENDLNLGQGLEEDQDVDQDMILYVTIKQNGKNMLAPMLYLSKKTIANNQIDSNIMGKTGVDINTQSFSSLLGGVSSNGEININASDKIDLHSSNLNAKNINLNANSINIDTILGIDEKGSYSSIKKGEIQGTNVVNINSKEDLNIKNSNISTSASDSKIVLRSENGNVNIKNDYSKSSSLKQIDKYGQKSNIAATVNGVLSTNIKGSNVEIVSNKDVNIVGSNISADSKININANNVNIKDAHELSKVKVDSVYLRPMEVSSESSNIETSKSVGSSLVSKGDININTSGNISIVGSALQANKAANLSGENIIIENGQSQISSSSHSSTNSITGYKESSVNTNASLVSSSQIQSGILNLNAQKNLTIKGSELNGGEININADKVDFIAAQNKTHTESNSLAIGILTNANLELAGYGVGLNYNFAQDEASANIKNPADGDGITQGGVRSDLFGAMEFGFEISKSEKTTEEISYVSNTIKGSNININANNALDIGGANFEADKDINLRAGEILSTKYEDTKTENGLSYGFYVKQKFEATSPIVSAINQLAQNVIAEDNGLNVNNGIIASQAIANTVNILSNKLVSGSSSQTVGIKVNHQKSQSSSENISKINAGGNLNLESTKGNIVLNGVEANANLINIKAKDNVILNAAKSENSSSELSFGVSASSKQNVGYHMVDGGTLSQGGEVSINASHSQSSETKFVNTSLNTNNININTGKDFVLNGANVKASNNVALNVGGNLEVNSLVNTSNSQKYSVSLSASASGGFSSNHTATGSASGSVGVGYAKTDKAEVATQSGISATNEINANINGDLKLQGGILNSDNKKGSLVVDGKITNSELAIYEKSDGATVKLSGGTDKSFGGVIDINDHIEKVGSVNSAVNIKINKNHNISTDTKNTTNIKDRSWVGGTINFSSSVSKIKSGIKNVTGSNSTSKQPSNPNPDQPYVNQTTETTRL